MGQRKQMPFSCVLGICGTDGSPLQPVTPVRGETRADIRKVLFPLLSSIVHERQTAGLSLEEACPAFVSTDTYHKHYRKYRALADEIAQLSRLRVRGQTPRGQVASCSVSNPAFEILVAGEPFHDVLNARRCVGPQANDSSDFCFDHADMLGRLNAPAPPARPQGEAAPPALGDAGRALLRAAVTQSAGGFAATLARDPVASVELRAFLASPGVRKAKVLWQGMFGAQPPRPVLARLARRAGAQLHPSLGWCNYRSRKAFKAEVRRMRQWYSKPRRLARRRRGILRVGPAAPESVRGRQCAFNGKLKSGRSARAEVELLRVEEQLKHVSRALERERWRAQNHQIESCIEQISEMWDQQKTAEAAALCRRVARCRSALKKRDGSRLGPAPLTEQQWLDVWHLGGELYTNCEVMAVMTVMTLTISWSRGRGR
ncbi:unnamed protein product [Prorocentrum cordatum]|uniref:Uncharacterized protein n=1 Tax=Prorocentrum cordatum TaxID=2364126 RepID=A0ABN9QDG5_9DINO|nr:unnamed protein product [Polarella glacialis]